jgi:hypothetical protein
VARLMRLFGNRWPRLMGLTASQAAARSKALLLLEPISHTRSPLPNWHRTCTVGREHCSCTTLDEITLYFANNNPLAERVLSNIKAALVFSLARLFLVNCVTVKGPIPNDSLLNPKRTDWFLLYSLAEIFLLG